MTKVFKKIVSLLLALMTVLSLVSVSAAAEYDPLGNLYVTDILRVDVDTLTYTARTFYINFANQFANHNSDINLLLLDESGQTVANLIPRADDPHYVDIFDTDGNSGVQVDPVREYTLLIPQGAFYISGSSTVNNEYRQVLTGIFICGAENRYNQRDLGIKTYLTTKYTGNVVFEGQLSFSSDFIDIDDDNCTVTLSKKETVDGKTVYTDIAVLSAVAFKSGCVTLSFGEAGVEIDKYASYKLTVSYGSFYCDSGYTLCSKSEFELSGKRLLKLRENYRLIDMLIKWFGKDHFTVKAIVKVLEILSKIKLVDTAYYKDVKGYVDAK